MQTFISNNVRVSQTVKSRRQTSIQWSWRLRTITQTKRSSTSSLVRQDRDTRHRFVSLWSGWRENKIMGLITTSLSTSSNSIDSWLLATLSTSTSTQTKRFTLSFPTPITLTRINFIYQSTPSGDRSTFSWARLWNTLLLLTTLTTKTFSLKKLDYIIPWKQFRSLPICFHQLLFRESTI